MKTDSLLPSAFFGALVAIGLIGGGYFIGQTMYNAKVAINTAESRGLAERRVKSDKAHWRVTFHVAGTQQNDVPELYKTSEAHQSRILSLLEKVGFDRREISTGVIDYNYREFRNKDQDLVDQRYELSGTVTVETDKVDLINEARSSMNSLIPEGIKIDNGEPQFFFTKLNDIKPEMIKEANQNARIAAEEFANSAGAKLGSIRSARQGSFIIKDVGRNYGDTRSIEKDVRIVTTVNFYLV